MVARYRTASVASRRRCAAATLLRVILPLHLGAADRPPTSPSHRLDGVAVLLCRPDGLTTSLCGLYQDGIDTTEIVSYVEIS